MVVLADKGGGFNEGLPQDMADLPWLGEYLTVLKGNRAPSARLWPFSHEEMVRWFQDALSWAGLAHYEAELYSLRHGGPSADRANQTRSAEAVQKRGRWASELSCRRYEQPGRLHVVLSRIPSAIWQLSLNVV